MKTDLDENNNLHRLLHIALSKQHNALLDVIASADSKSNSEKECAAMLDSAKALNNINKKLVKNDSTYNILVSFLQEMDSMKTTINKIMTRKTNVRGFPELKKNISGLKSKISSLKKLHSNSKLTVAYALIEQLEAQVNIIEELIKVLSDGNLNSIYYKRLASNILSIISCGAFNATGISISNEVQVVQNCIFKSLAKREYLKNYIQSIIDTPETEPLDENIKTVLDDTDIVLASPMSPGDFFHKIDYYLANISSPYNIIYDLGSTSNTKEVNINSFAGYNNSLNATCGILSAVGVITCVGSIAIEKNLNNQQKKTIDIAKKLKEKDLIKLDDLTEEEHSGISKQISNYMKTHKNITNFISNLNSKLKQKNVSSDITTQDTEKLNLILKIREKANDFSKSREDLHELCEEIYSSNGKDLTPKLLHLNHRFFGEFRNAREAQENLVECLKEILKNPLLSTEEKEEVNNILSDLSLSQESLMNLEDSTSKVIDFITKNPDKEISDEFKSAKKNLKTALYVDKLRYKASISSMYFLGALLVCGTTSLILNPITGPITALALLTNIISYTCLGISLTNLSLGLYSFRKKNKTKNSLSKIMLKRKIDSRKEFLIRSQMSFKKDKNQEEDKILKTTKKI